MFKLALAACLLLTWGCVAQTREGRPFNEDRQCWGALQEAGEYSGPDGCDLVITYARAPDGELWQFSDACPPDNFTVVRDDALRATLSATSPCEQAVMP